MKSIPPGLWPPWTKSAETSQKKAFSKECHSSLVAIALTFQSANECVAEVPAAYFRALREADAIGKPLPDEEDYDIILGVDDRSWIYGNRIFQNRYNVEECQVTEQVLDKIIDLDDTNFNYYWRRALNSFNLAFQEGVGSVAARYAKQYALDLLEHRDKAAKHVDLISDELRRKGYEELLEGILDKIRFLERFKAVYDARDNDHQAEPIYHLYPMETRRNPPKIHSESQKQLPAGYTSALISIVSIVTLIAIIPLGFAWKLSTSQPGSILDADFYLLLQNSVTTLLGLFIGIYPTLWQRASIDNRWAHGLAFVGASCAIVSIPLYLKVVTIWSAVVAFMGQAIQGYMAMQLSMAAGYRPKREKQD